MKNLIAKEQKELNNAWKAYNAASLNLSEQSLKTSPKPSSKMIALLNKQTEALRIRYEAKLTAKVEAVTRLVEVGSLIKVEPKMVGTYRVERINARPAPYTGVNDYTVALCDHPKKDVLYAFRNSQSYFRTFQVCAIYNNK